ncbi:fungal-specific transcription factor domain-containing protein [Annulohypoxylon maeteangense]|uniref:fungal-specific transcription factor domain-containing protein n=1 Tax=Annulohypoxylon maeteangense TaxID=1927788 RepID=UPI0020081F8B|nr:fungal-specific transcription factor domain-containing protein [Annulohypoxylon maeteangense]KAI0880215.1 fungal-specific transcription factor domain-containing protein [Annulohypoxylon maeteangense]
MQSPGSQDRPYRSHLRPACLPCRKRKSRCKIEAQSLSCLMCRAHGTECEFPTKPQSSSIQGKINKGQKVQARERTVSENAPRRPPHLTLYDHEGIADGRPAIINDPNSVVLDTPWDGMNTPKAHPTIHHGPDESQQTPLSIEDTENENPHIISPAMTSDSQVLTDYLSTMGSDGCGIRLIRPQRPKQANGTRQVLFTAVQKRPVGLTISPSPSHTKCEIIEKLLGPWTEKMVDLFFERANICFPLLDEASFRSRYATAKDRVSPALLACLYANSLIYWRYEPQLTGQRPPDIRFIWNLASEAAQSELFLSPGMSTITAVLLDVGGRPTTALVGNGVRLGSAISLAYSLGLNHDPLSWDISSSEKMLRMHIWWSLLIHDRWSSLAYGTPPHIQRSFYDVPQPKMEYQLNKSDSPRRLGAMGIFVALSRLTNILDYYLQYLYQVDKDADTLVTNLELRLNRWVESLEDGARQVITRGASLHIPGAPNLRLAYLSIQLLTHRIRMENTRSRTEVDEDDLANQYIQIRRTAENILCLVQELQEEHLGDFWLPISAFTFPSTVTFLLRCALETGKSPKDLAESSSFKLARDLVTALRRHRDNSGWDLGDICLAQHAEVIEKLASPVQAVEDSASITSFGDLMIPDDLFIDDFNDIFSGF